ncbi:LysR family transcriptional regulator [Rahnella sp. CG8]|uniref:LysR family transcriptional regulator n=1 Tax=Rahnella sp. CG8 TaxID=2726078 RepID=UPI0020338890|nr:LysR family transcriptional regulator [Rahnella sp. CG8]
MAMSSKQLDVFVKVVQLGSVTAAAQALGMSQPSVSKSLALVEQQIGFTLFERANGKMVPTPEAEQVFEEAMRMQEGMARFERFLDHVRRYRFGQLRICATPALAINILPLAAAMFRQEFPDYGLVLDMCLNNDIENAVGQGQYDLGFIIQPEESSTPVGNLVCRGEIVCVMPQTHPLAAQAAVTWDDIDPRELIYITTDPRLIAMMSAAIPGFRERPVSALETNRYTMAVNLVRQGAGLTLVDEFTLSGTNIDGLSIKPFIPKLPIAITAITAGRSVAAQPTERFIKAMRTLIDTPSRRE